MDHVDVIIVGAGITGIDMASSLIGRGKDVLVMDRSMDLGFPPAGPCLISIDTYNRYLKDYESHVNGIFSSATILGENYEEEIKLEPKNNIVSMDREKLVRGMAYNFSQKGGKLKIASTIKRIEVEESRNIVGWIREGRMDEISCDSVIINTGKIDGEFLFHSGQCKRSNTEAHYVRYIPEKKAEYFTLEFGKNHMSVSSSNGILGEDLNIFSKPREKGIISATSYHVENHTCFPLASSGVFPGGNTMGSENYLGRGIEFSLSYNRKLVEEIDDEWDETNLEMEKYFHEMQNARNVAGRDLLETVLYRIPILS